MTDIERYGAASGWETSSAAGSLVPTEGGAIGVAVREESELKAALVLARSFPRDEPAAYARLMNSCDRPGFAEGAEYSFPRGGQNVTGPSVDLAREAARCWGNIRYGLRIVSEDDERVHIKGYAYDCETNNMVEAEDKFAKLVQRKRKGGGATDWIKPDERDLRELVNRRGAILVRNCLLQILPPDVIDDARERTRRTLHSAARGEIAQDRDAAIRRLALAFERFGVGTAVLAEFLGHELQAITPDELAELRRVWKSIADGQSKREDHFDTFRNRNGGGSEKADELNEALRAEEPAADASPEAAKDGIAALLRLVNDMRGTGRGELANDAQRGRISWLAATFSEDADTAARLTDLAEDQKLTAAQAEKVLTAAAEAGLMVTGGDASPPESSGPAAGDGLFDRREP